MRFHHCTKISTTLFSLFSQINNNNYYLFILLFSSPQGVAQLKLDYNKLIDYITDPSNGLRPSTHTLINNLGACQDIEKGLEILSSRETEVGGASEEGGVKLMGCQDVYLLKVCKRLDILEKIAWLDYNEWKRIL